MSLIVGGVGSVARANIWERSVWMVKEASDFLRGHGRKKNRRPRRGHWRGRRCWGRRKKD